LIINLIPSKITTIGILAVFVLVILTFILYPFHQVDAGFVGVKTVFGSPQPEVLMPGLHWKTPITTSIYDVSTQPQSATTNESAATHDLQNATTTVAISFQINPKDAVSFYSNYRTMDYLYSVRIKPVVSNDVREITAQYDSQDLVTKRQQVDGEIEDRISNDLSKFDIIVSQVNLTNFDFSADYDAAIESKQVSYQKSLAAQYSLDQKKVDAQQNVVEAQASAQAAIATAQGNAQATLLQAKADSEAYKLKQASLTPDIIAMMYAQHWDGHLPTYMTTPVPFFDPTQGVNLTNTPTKTP
jgi:regulator of protease activity HflC (stomatin/prohibitin superfamily)